MYDDLVERLRADADYMDNNGIMLYAAAPFYRECADAIEELQHSLEIMGDANAKLRDAAWDVTCDPEYRESHFHKNDWGEW